MTTVSGPAERLFAGVEQQSDSIHIFGREKKFLKSKSCLRKHGAARVTVFLYENAFMDENVINFKQETNEYRTKSLQKMILDGRNSAGFLNFFGDYLHYFLRGTS